MLKKWLYFLLAASLLASALAGCSTPAPQATQPAEEVEVVPTAAEEEAEPTAAEAEAEPTPKPTDAPAKAEGVNLTLAHVQGEWLWPVLEELGKMYQAKSGNTVEFLYVPAEGATEWAQAQLVAGTEPDIFWGFLTGSDAFKNGQVIDLKNYYEENSPYTGKPWKDSFLDGLLEGVVDQTGGEAMFGMPLAMVTVNLYYNKDIFAELGIPDEPLLSWGEVLSTCKKVQESGKDYTPFAVMNSIDWNLWWMRGNFLEDLFVNSGIVEKLDVITPNGKLETPEIVLGVKNGVIDMEDPRFVDYFKFMKELSQCFNKGFNVVSWEYEKLFLEGQAAMWLDGSWFPNQLLTGNIDLNYGTGPLPYVDDSVSTHSRNQPMKYAIGLGNADLMVSAKAQKDGKADAAVDFLRFLSDPATGAKYFVEKTMFLPVVKEVAVPEGMKGIVDWIGTDTSVTNAYVVWYMTTEESDKFREMFKVFLEDDSTPEEFAAQVKDLALQAADQYIEEHPEEKVEDYLD